jgi:hypothetical protein
MVTKTHFQNFDFTTEQKLLDDLVSESIQIYGQDMYYLPLRSTSFDNTYYEDDSTFFDTYYILEMYVDTYEGFGGQGSFMSNMGLEIRDEMTLTISRSRFEEEVSSKENFFRPREGDLIYFPLNQKSFVITYVDDKPYFYQFGDRQMYKVQCALFEYGGEKMQTGVPEIDDLQERYSIDILDYSIVSEDNISYMTEDNKYMLVTEKYWDNQDKYDPTVDNDRIEDLISKDTDDTLIDWGEVNPFSGNTSGGGKF